MPSPQEYQAQDEAFSKQFAEQQAQKAQETAQAGQPQTFLQKWTAPVGRVTTQILDNAVSGAQLIYDTPGMKKARDVASGAITGVTNIADTVVKGANKAAELLQPAAEAQRDLGIGAAPQPVIPEPIWDHAKQHIMDFRDAVQVQDPTLSDNLTQSVAQLAIPFAGYSRALSGLHWVAQAATAGALTDATALGPHDARMADMLALGRHTEGKFGEVLRTLAPDGSALNAYINYLHDRTNETEAEGRFKNVLDGFGVNMVATPLLHSVGMLLKQGTAGLRYMVDNGVPSSGALVPPSPKMQRGAVGDLSAKPVDMYSQLVQKRDDLIKQQTDLWAELDKHQKDTIAGDAPRENYWPRANALRAKIKTANEQERALNIKVADMATLKYKQVKQAFDDLTAARRARQDMRSTASNPNGARPPLQQGSDPAEPLYEAEIRRHTENASGESSASQEAINRHTSEQEAGVSRWRIDPDGNRVPLVGVDAVDAAAPKGSIHVIRDAEGNEVITDRGGLTQVHAKGLLARSKLRGEGK